MSTDSESLSQLEVLVVDCQATAAAPHGHLLEMGWARAGMTTTRPDTRLIALPDGEHIPAAVMRLTGISERMARDGVDAHTVWRELTNEATTLLKQPAPTVIHFARSSVHFCARWPAASFPSTSSARMTSPAACCPICPGAACGPSRGTSADR
jgi:hypothetical protein